MLLWLFDPFNNVVAAEEFTVGKVIEVVEVERRLKSLGTSTNLEVAAGAVVAAPVDKKLVPLEAVVDRFRMLPAGVTTVFT